MRPFILQDHVFIYLSLRHVIGVQKSILLTDLRARYSSAPTKARPVAMNHDFSPPPKFILLAWDEDSQE